MICEIFCCLNLVFLGAVNAFDHSSFTSRSVGKIIQGLWSPKFHHDCWKLYGLYSMSCKGLYRHVEERWIDCEYIYHKNNYEFWIAAFASLNLPTHACTDNCPKHLWLILLPLLGYKIFNCSYRWKLHAWANLCKQHYKLCNSILQAHMPHRTSTYHSTAKWCALLWPHSPSRLTIQFCA